MWIIWNQYKKQYCSPIQKSLMELMQAIDTVDYFEDSLLQTCLYNYYWPYIKITKPT